MARRSRDPRLQRPALNGNNSGHYAPPLLATINAKWIHPSLALRLLKANLGALEEHSAIMEFALRRR